MRSLFCLGLLVATALGEEDVVFDIGPENDLGESPKIETREVDFVTGTFVPPQTPRSALIADIISSKDSLQQWQSLLNNDVYKGNWDIELAHSWFSNDYRLKMGSSSMHHGIARQLPKTWSPADGSLFGSIEVRFPAEHTCGGAYFKLFNTNNPADLDGKTPYSIMFGPDHCGPTNEKIHLIIQKDVGESERVEFPFKLLQKLPQRKTIAHQYGFELHKDSTYKFYVDGEVKDEGNILDSCLECFKAPATIPDPTDVEPSDWTPPPARIPDPDVTKPEDWDESQPETIPDYDTPAPEGWYFDEPLMVPNPDATKPEDWNDEEDGEWELPLMKNPKCKVGCGKWEPTKPNPLYKGVWEAPLIPNPDYTPHYPQRRIDNPNHWDFTDSPFDAIEPFNAIGFELWTVEAGVEIDNVYVGTDGVEFKEWLEATRKERLRLEEVNRKLETEAKTMEESKDTETQVGYSWMRDSNTYTACGLGAVLLSFASYYVYRKRAAIVRSAVPVGADKKTDEAPAASTVEDKSVEKETEHTTAETEVDENSQIRRRKQSDDNADDKTSD